MTKYLFEANYVGEGIKGLMREGGTKRRDAVVEALKSVGGSLECFYYAFGETDVLGVFENPGTGRRRRPFAHDQFDGLRERASETAHDTGGSRRSSQEDTVIPGPRAIEHQPPGSWADRTGFAGAEHRLQSPKTFVQTSGLGAGLPNNSVMVRLSRNSASCQSDKLPLGRQRSETPWPRIRPRAEPRRHPSAPAGDPGPADQAQLSSRGC